MWLSHYPAAMIVVGVLALVITGLGIITAIGLLIGWLRRRSNEKESKEFERLSVATGQGETRPHAARNWIEVIFDLFHS
jgi:hypothetical protein